MITKQNISIKVFPTENLYSRVVNLVIDGKTKTHVTLELKQAKDLVASLKYAIDSLESLRYIKL